MSVHWEEIPFRVHNLFYALIYLRLTQTSNIWHIVYFYASVQRTILLEDIVNVYTVSIAVYETMYQLTSIIFSFLAVLINFVSTRSIKLVINGKRD